VDLTFICMGSSSFLLLVFVHHLSGSVSLHSLRGLSVLPVFVGPDFDYSGVDSAADAVLHLDVQFGDDISLESSVFFEILLG